MSLLRGQLLRLRFLVAGVGCRCRISLFEFFERHTQAFPVEGNGRLKLQALNYMQKEASL